MSIRSSLVLAVSFGLVLASAHTVGAQLTLQQVKDLAKCQDTTDKEGRNLIKKELEAVEGCALAKLNPALREENGLITPDKFIADNDKATAKCNSLFSKVATTSTKFIEKVIEACSPVEAIILAPDAPPAGDPLGFVAFWNPASVAELAGILCADAIFGADFLAEAKAPRGVEIVFNDPDVVFDNLDARCQ